MIKKLGYRNKIARPQQQLKWPCTNLFHR